MKRILTLPAVDLYRGTVADTADAWKRIVGFLAMTLKK